MIFARLPTSRKTPQKYHEAKIIGADSVHSPDVLLKPVAIPAKTKAIVFQAAKP